MAVHIADSENLILGENFLDDEDKILVSIVLPCLNEVKTLPQCIANAIAAIDKLGVVGEVVVADNGSSDGSQQLAEQLGARVVDVSIPGYGAAIIGGVMNARGRYIAMGDADCSYDFLDAVPIFYELFKGSDFCMGSRFRGKIMPGAMPWHHRHIGTPILTAIINLLHRGRYSDINCGLRAFSKKAFLEMSLESSGMELASEMVIKASLLGFNISEVPITLHKDGRDRKPHLKSWSDGWRHLKYIVLFAPRVIYWVPGFLMLLSGLIMLIALNSVPSGQNFYVSHLRFNDHWMVLAALISIIGYELILTGVTTYLYTSIHRLSKQSRFIDKLVNIVHIERIFFLSLALFTLGLIPELWVLKTWIANAFGPLNAIRPAVTGLILIMLSMQTFFHGVFYTILLDQYQKKALLGMLKMSGGLTKLDSVLT